MPQAKVVKPHGTAQRYWQKCRCQPCKDAVNEHIKARKRAKSAPASASRSSRSTPPPARPRRVIRRTVEAEVVDTTQPEFESLASEICSLNNQLRAAEARYAKAANELLRDYKVVPVGAAAGQES